ncbi:gamma-glutamylcyclotransferase [Ruegeria sp. WL0004]|uniref:glutathione-specific gamma-glutamylcyclotransferase n=1 Tax=Ruegeria marisflavi TaxID=2984152 RepID=A0ABT2WUV3_9RHOB|nr:gamma-glutamylcyclotransferase [Ruegeria sp. WL0004]MCU9839689.1 gamma-glutamylcyclotransferase [Ruegeria sp. WL0004]
MPFPHHVFRHTPALRGLITPPDESELRFGLDRFAELDIQAEKEGWPPGWRMEHDAREANRLGVLEGRMVQDLWVFAYGSLIWDPAVQVEEYRYGTLPGWRRSFCMRLEGGRGSFARPGLMAALDEGGHCDGVAMRISGPLVDQETQFMWRREMFSGAYRPLFLEVATPQGPVEALTFVMDRDNRRYMPDLPEDDAARMIAVAEGNLGPNFAYLDSLVRHLDELGIADDDMHRLHARAQNYRLGAM